MKKIIPLILLAVGIIALVVVFFVVKAKKAKVPVSEEEESVLIDVAFKDRPVMSLTPTGDGHYLKLKIEKIVIPATSLDYELLYQTKDDVTQGVPGSVTIEKGKPFEVDLLLGSESSGKFRYDEGVETGSVTLRFRNEAGKLIARFASDFHLQSATDTLTSSDGDFSFKLDKKSSDFFVTMNTLGLQEGGDSVNSGPIGIFSSSGSLPKGSPEDSWQSSGDKYFFK